MCDREKLMDLADDLKLLDPAGTISIRYVYGTGWEIHLFTEDFLSIAGDRYTTRTCKGIQGEPFHLAEHEADGVRFIAIVPAPKTVETAA